MRPRLRRSNSCNPRARTAGSLKDFHARQRGVELARLVHETVHGVDALRAGDTALYQRKAQNRYSIEDLGMIFHCVELGQPSRKKRWGLVDARTLPETSSVHLSTRLDVQGEGKFAPALFARRIRACLHTVFGAGFTLL
jgi:hypothetical protein